MSHQGHHTLTAKDVVFVEGYDRSASLFKNDATLRIKDLLKKIEAICVKSGELSNEEVAILFGNGIACEVLRPGAADWQTGSLHLNLQFQTGEGAIAAPELSAATVNPPAAVAAPAAAPVVEMPVVEMPVVEMPVVEMPAAETSVADVEEPVADAFADQDFNAFADSGMADSALGFDSLGDGFDGDELSLDDSPALNLDGALIQENAAENEFDADLMGLMDDAAPADSDFSGLDGFDLDSTATPVESIDDLSSPWDLSEDLDSMLMAN